MTIDAFAVAFKEQIEFLQNRLDLSGDEWRKILDAAGDASTILAAGQKDAMARDLLKAVEESLASGKGFAEFRDEYERIVKKHGWDGEAAWHAQLIFRTQTSIARAAGRWQQIQRVKSLRRWLVYKTVDDARVRPEHAAWHNIVLPVDHQFWKTHFPPNGFNCRCRVTSLNDRDLKRYDYQPTDLAHPVLQLPPDNGWSGNVGETGLLLAEQATQGSGR